MSRENSRGDYDEETSQRIDRVWKEDARQSHDRNNQWNPLCEIPARPHLGLREGRLGASTFPKDELPGIPSRIVRLMEMLARLGWALSYFGAYLLILWVVSSIVEK